MKRRLVQLALLLLLGAIINVAVAWAFMLFGNSIGASYVTLQTPDARAPTGFAKVQILRCGWPFCSLEGEATFLIVGGGHMFVRGTRISSYGTIPLQGSNVDLYPFRFGFVPICPVWPGFAINTIFYAAILWVPFAATGAFRRRRRTKRGLCPACAYPVGTRDVCTECGKPIKS